MLRTATADDLPAIATVEGRAFGSHYDDTDLTDFRPLFEPERFLLGCDPDDGHILGVTGAFGFQLTLPGAAVVDAPGVSWVSVSTTHRRRGILRTLMLAQHEGFVADGYPVALLYASEGGIYGRFGYGPATARHAVEIDRRFAAFRPDAPDPGGVAQVDTAAIRCAGPEIHRRWCAHTPGALDRSPVWWANVLLDREHRRGGASALFHLLHADGYASYRIQDADRTCRVVELFAVTDRAYVALWRVLLGLDLVHTVTTMACAPDDPLPFLLTDPRQVRTTGLADGMWARVLDVVAALGARRYACEVDLVLDVHDSFLNRGGRFRLRGGSDGACCAPSTAEPDVHLDIAALGSLLLGGHRVSTLARAGLVEGEPGGVQVLDAALLAERRPRNGNEF